MAAHYDCIFNEESTVDAYGSLRHIPLGVLEACAKVVLNQQNEAGVFSVVDAGSGTGRFSLPIRTVAEQRGVTLSLIPIDLSGAMTSQLVSLLARSPNLGSTRVSPVVGDLINLPLKPEAISAIFTAATFHILDDWRRAAKSLVESLLPRGAFILVREYNQFMHQTEGFSRDRDFSRLDGPLSEFMTYYHWLREREDLPYSQNEIRYSDMLPLREFLIELGLSLEAECEDDPALSWEKPHSFREILVCFEQRNMTTWGSDLPAGARARISSSLLQWVRDRGIPFDEEFTLPAYLSVDVLRRS